MGTEPSGSLVAQIDSGPYRLDITIWLTSGGRVTFAGTGLDRAGMCELLDIVRQAVADG